MEGLRVLEVGGGLTCELLRKSSGVCASCGKAMALLFLCLVCNLSIGSSNIWRDTNLGLAVEIC